MLAIKRYLYSIATDKTHGGFSPLVKLFLWILSWFYRLIVAVRRIFYKIGILKVHTLTRPVLCVGNLTVGGAGKTPLIGYITKHVQEKGLRPVILTRGYMEKGTDSDGQTSDEAAMLQDTLGDVPVLVGADRIKSANKYLEHNEANVFLMDDGFQRLRIHRDIDIVAVDATNPWGNGYLLPRGILREPRAALKRAQIIVITKADLAKEKVQQIRDNIASVNPKALIVESKHKPVRFVDGRTGVASELDIINGQEICALSSIGAPESFEQTLTSLNAVIKKHFVYMDHFQYAKCDILSIINACRDSGVSTIVTTEKDLVKLKRFLIEIPGQIHLLVLKVRIEITEGEDQFLERIHHLL